ncbi:MAG: hypothetical protein QM817_31570 [Archangium sp.]
MTRRIRSFVTAVPDVILESLAARPDDVGVWQVLTDFLLETGAPGASLAMCELELMKGISNPDLLGELAEARAQREKLPFEPWGGYPALWKCGFVVRMQLSLQSRTSELPAVLKAPAMRGLHHLILSEDSGRTGALLFGTEEERLAWPTISQRLPTLLGAVTPHLRRLSLRVEERYVPLQAEEQRAALRALLSALPRKLDRLDLALGVLHELSIEPLLELISQVPSVCLDGTRLPLSPGFADQLQSVSTGHVYLAGTGLSPRNVTAKDWLAPDVKTWLELESTGALVPLTAVATPDGFDSPAWPRLRAYLQKDLLGFSVQGELLEPGAVLNLDDVLAVFRRR